MLTLTCEQVRRVDELAAQDYAMPTIVLMENASANAARILLHEFSHLTNPSVTVFCGPGNNGGDGFAIARHLHNVGWTVQVLLAVSPEKLKGDALTNYTIITKMGLPITGPETADEILSQADVIIDALLGTGSSGEPRPPFDTLIRKINAAAKPVVSIDIPSGMDCARGTASETTVRATHTITFVAAKDTFLKPELEPFLGRLHVTWIGMPIELIDRVQHVSV